MPKRGVVALIITGLALVLLLNFKTPTTVSSPLAFGNPAIASAPPTATSGAAGGSATGSSSTGTGTGTGGTAASSSATPAPSGTTPPGGTTASGYKSGTFTGSVVQLPFGPVQVSVTIANGKITGVQPLQYPTDHAQSAAISQYAIPTLIQQTLQVQSAQVSLISGATYTSAAYQQSLQSALDQAHA